MLAAAAALVGCSTQPKGTVKCEIYGAIDNLEEVGYVRIVDQWAVYTGLDLCTQLLMHLVEQLTSDAHLRDLIRILQTNHDISPSRPSGWTRKSCPYPGRRR